MGGPNYDKQVESTQDVADGPLMPQSATSMGPLSGLAQYGNAAVQAALFQGGGALAGGQSLALAGGGASAAGLTALGTLAAATGDWGLAAARDMQRGAGAARGVGPPENDPVVPAAGATGGPLQDSNLVKKLPGLVGEAIGRGPDLLKQGIDGLSKLFGGDKKATEYILAVGGEYKTNSENFVNALDLRLQQLAEQLKTDPNALDGADLSVMFFRGTHDRLGTYDEVKKSLDEKISAFEKLTGKKVNLVQPNSADEFVNYMNTGSLDGKSNVRDDKKIEGWEYFGHGLEGALAPEYVEGMAEDRKDRITKNTIKKIDASAFDQNGGKGPTFKSWGCNTATASGDDNKSWLETYHDKVGGTAIGANGFTWYGDVKYSKNKPWNWFKDPKIPYPIDGAKWIELTPTGPKGNTPANTPAPPATPAPAPAPARVS